MLNGISDLCQHWFSYGYSPNRHQTINLTNADLLSIGPPGTNCSKIWNKILNSLSNKCIWKSSLQKVGHFFFQQNMFKRIKDISNMLVSFVIGGLIFSQAEVSRMISSQSKGIATEKKRQFPGTRKNIAYPILLKSVLTLRQLSHFFFKI